MSFKEDLRRSVMLTFDVEDNFTKSELVRPGDWDIYESQIVVNTRRVINLLGELDATATFFVVGMVAERHPEVVRTIVEAGHEVASHGYSHELVTKMTKQEFEEDLSKSISILENITLKRIKGFRARSFSITKETLWALEILEKNEVVYDSSMIDAEFKSIQESNTISSGAVLNLNLVELPISSKRLFGKNLAISGGILLRILPFFVYKKLLNISPTVSHRNKIIYCHVWEFNKDQPKRNVGLLQAIFQSPLNYTTEKKMRKLWKYYDFISIEQFLNSVR